MKILLFCFLCTNAIVLSLAAPQYVNPYATPLPQFSQLSSTPYTGYGQSIRIWPWVIGQYAFPNYQYYSNYWTSNNNNPYSYPYNRNNNPYNVNNPYNQYNPYNLYNPYNKYNPYNQYNPYNNRDTATNTYWNGFAWVNSFRSANRTRK